MSRPILLVFLLVILIVTCQFEWRQPLVELDAAPSLSQKHKLISMREEAVKEKCYNRGGRSIGSHRNFCSKPASINDPKVVVSISYLQLPTRRNYGICSSVCFGFSVYGCWDLYNYFPKWKKDHEELKLLKQRWNEEPQGKQISSPLSRLKRQGPGAPRD